MASRELLVTWLRDAYAMEQAIAQVLEGQVAGAIGHPVLQRRLREHLEQTRGHADLVKRCLERHGEPAPVRGAVPVVTEGIVPGAFRSGADDTAVKIGLRALSMEHFEIASYRALRWAAHDIGDRETERVCRAILREEEAMAHWLDGRMPTLVHETLRGNTPGSAAGARRRRRTSTRPGEAPHAAR